MTTFELRSFIYDVVISTGSPPRLADIAQHFGITAEAARIAVANLKIGKTVLPHPQTGEIWMAGPFSSSPTSYRLTGSSTWFANCAWDMLGIPFIVRETVRVETKCAHCDVRLAFDATPSAPPAVDGIVHFLVPARRWYDDIGFT